MKIIILSVLTLLIIALNSNAQHAKFFHEGKFNKFKGVMHSGQYKADDWEKILYDKADKAIFPLDIRKSPENYIGNLIHWIGIVEEVLVEERNDSSIIIITLEQKYWDYIEDYSIQDEVMFISPKGEGAFKIIVASEKLSENEIETIKKFPNEMKLFLCYGELMNCQNGIPTLSVEGIKIIDYKYYSTKIFSYDILRDEKGQVVVNKSGKAMTTNFESLKVPGPGQNK